VGFCPTAEKHKYSFDGARIPLDAYAESNAKMIGNSSTVAGISQQTLAQRGLAEGPRVPAGNQACETRHASLRSNPIKNVRAFPENTLEQLQILARHVRTVGCSLQFRQEYFHFSATHFQLPKLNR
jgi:hypothetical protein